jgi:hypothetical protein
MQKKRMTWHSLLLAAMFLLVPLLLLPDCHIAAASSHQGIPASDAPTGHLTILVLDMSGSMAANDPDQVRCQAAQAYIDLSGPGNTIGIIGLAGQQAQIWQEPFPTDVVSQRAALKQTIEQRPAGSPDCQHPSGNTPTASALDLAWNMLNTTTARQNLQGSVILLSDGVPSPNTNGQLNTIQNTLIPLFQQRHWPIDTIALGTEQVLRPFMQNLARRTGGIAYDDAQGAVPAQTSSLNILSFFTDILSQRTGRTPTHIAPLTTLAADSKAYNLTLGTSVKEVDILLVRDAREGASVHAQLTSPAAEPIVLPSPVAIPYTDVEQNPSYIFFSITGPHAGVWELDVNGNGRFEISMLETSFLQTTFLSPQLNGTLLNINSPFPLLAEIVDIRSPAVPLTLPGLTLNAAITYQGESGRIAPSFTTQHYAMKGGAASNPGQYQATIHLPTSASDGVYTLTVSASGETSEIISENTLTVRLAHFPEPVLASPQAVEYQWPAWIAPISHFAPLSWLYAAAFADSRPRILGQIKTGTALSAAALLLQATQVSPAGVQTPLTVVSGQRATFQLFLPEEPPGDYTIDLTLNGTFENFSGNMGDTLLIIHLQSAAATGQMIVGFLALTLVLSLLTLTFLLGLYLFLTGPGPSGTCVCENPQEVFDFTKARRGFGPWRNCPRSEMVPSRSGTHPHLQKGLRFRFARTFWLVGERRIKVRLCGPDGVYWTASLDGKEQKLSRRRFRPVSHLCYCLRIDRHIKPLQLHTYTLLAREP